MASILEKIEKKMREEAESGAGRVGRNQGNVDVEILSFADDMCMGNRTARGLQYSGPVITPRVQHGLQIQYNTIQYNVHGHR